MGGKFAVSPYQRKWFQKDQEAVATFFCNRISYYCCKQFESPASDNNSGASSATAVPPSHQALKAYFEATFGLPLRKRNCDQYPQLYSADSIKKWLSLLANGSFEQPRTLFFIYSLLRDYLVDQEGFSHQQLPHFDEIFVALDETIRAGVDETENVFANSKRAAQGGVCVSLTYRVDGAPRAVVTERKFRLADRATTASAGNPPAPDKLADSSTEEIRGSAITVAPQASHSDNSEDQLANDDIAINADQNSDSPAANSAASANYAVRKLVWNKLVVSLLIVVVTTIIVIGVTTITGVDKQPKLMASLALDDDEVINERKLYDLVNEAKTRVEQAPENTEALFQYANLLDQIHQYQAAKDYYAAAIEHQPLHIGARNNLARLNTITGHAREAATDLEALLAGSTVAISERPYLYKNLAWAYLEQELFQQAQATLDHLWLEPSYQQTDGINAATHCLQALINKPQAKPWRESAQTCLSAYQGKDHPYLEPIWAATLREWQQ